MGTYYKIDPREKQLPKWVQDHINSLRSTIRTQQQELEQEVGDSNTFRRAQYPIEDEALGKDTRIKFVTTKSTWNNTFEVHIEGDVLKIYCTSAPSITPTSSNCIELEMRRR